MKRCYKCKQNKDKTEFYKASREKDGLAGWCKACAAVYAKKHYKANKKAWSKYRRQHYIDNKDHTKEVNRKYRELNKKKIAERNRRYNALHKTEQKAYRDAHRKQKNEYARQYRIDNKELLKVNYRAYTEKNRKRINAKQREYNKTPKGISISKKHRENKKQYYKEKNREWYKNNKDKSRAFTRKRRDLQLKHDYKFTTEDEKVVRKRFDNKCFVCDGVDRLQIDHHRPLSSGNGLDISNAVLLCISCNSTKGDKMPDKFYTESQLEKLKEMGIE